MISTIKKYSKGSDTTIWVLFILLCLISAVEMFSATSMLAFRAANHTAPILRHVVFLAIGVSIAFVTHLLPATWIRFLGYVLMGISLVLLVLVLFMGVTTNHAARWFHIAGVQFQPSELGKLSLIIVSADLIARYNYNKINEHKYFRYLVILTAVVCLLIIGENFSTAALLFAVIWCMMVIGKLSSRKILMLTGGIVAFVVISFGVYKMLPKDKVPSLLKRYETVENRVLRKFKDGKTAENKFVIRDENRQEQNAKIAIARGGFFGLMPGNSVQRDYLDQAYSDFIYAIIVEETGLVGGLALILIYMALLFRAGRIATKSKTIFPAIVVIGLTLMIVFQAFVNMAVSSGLIPVTGQPMPLVSRGGTSIVITSIYFGIILGVTRQIKNETIKPFVDEEDLVAIDLIDDDDE